jgi:hypothetical protein
MGMGPDREWKRYQLAMMKSDFRTAVSIARSAELILDLRDALDLTVLGGETRDPIFDPMAVRWITVLHEAGSRSLGELRWLAERFEAIAAGDGSAPEQLRAYLARGYRAPP